MVLEVTVEQHKLHMNLFCGRMNFFGQMGKRNSIMSSTNRCAFALIGREYVWETPFVISVVASPRILVFD